MIGIVTAKTTAAGGAPTSALAVESESKHGGSEGLCRVLQIFSLVSAVEYLISPLCSANHRGQNEMAFSSSELDICPASAPVGASFGTPC